MRDPAGKGDSRDEYPLFIRKLAPGPVLPPATTDGWERRLALVRKGLVHSFGRTPDAPCPLEAEVLGILRRPGYAIERLTFQSRPGVRVTANLYRPEPSGKRYPGVLSVHGHWAWARIDPTVQLRCIGLARLGYVCLCVDAFGAGERAINPEPGTYHGGLVGASLWPVGTPLLGLQVYDNRRAVDYLISRPEVDGTRLAITGASGGGNQTLYAGATDPRLTAVVPVCSIGTYESYLTAACCVCEVNVGGIQYGTTGDLLAMVAPRSLLVVSASRDALQFSAGEAARSVAYARERYRQMGHEERVRHITIDSGHDYNRPMREAMYGWLERWLKSEGHGDPVAEPEVQPEDPQALRCYPDGASRPPTIVTIPQFAHREGLARLSALPGPPDHRERWEADSVRMKTQLWDAVLGGFPRRGQAEIRTRQGATPGNIKIEMTPETGLRLRGVLHLARPDRPRRGTVMVIGDDAGVNEDVPAVLAPWLAAGFCAALVGVRATGPNKPHTPVIAGVADHNEAEWALWLGRPLLGQWVWDILRWIEVLELLGRKPDRFGLPGALPSPLTLVGRGSISLSTILAAGYDTRAGTTVVDHCLVSFVPPAPAVWAKLGMGMIAPNILDVGDVPQLAALIGPRRLVISSGVEADGSEAAPERLQRAFTFTRSVFDLVGNPRALILGVSGDVISVI